MYFGPLGFQMEAKEDKVNGNGWWWHGSLAFSLLKGECEAVVVAKVWTIQSRKVAVIGMLDKSAYLAGIQVCIRDGEGDTQRDPEGDSQLTSKPIDELLLNTRFETDELSLFVFGDKVVAMVTIDGQMLAASRLSEREVEGGRVISFPVSRTDLTAGDEDSWEVRVNFDA